VPGQARWKFVAKLKTLLIEIERAK